MWKKNKALLTACWCCGPWSLSLWRSSYNIPPISTCLTTLVQKGDGTKEEWRDCISHSAPPFPASHPFNPATAPGAILMLLNADVVKMCLKEQGPAGRAVAHVCRVQRTHTHTHTLIHAHTGYSKEPWVLKHIDHLHSEGHLSQMLSPCSTWSVPEPA